jgi:transcriptional regulator with XRE-family HTH domain
MGAAFETNRSNAPVRSPCHTPPMASKGGRPAEKPLAEFGKRLRAVMAWPENETKYPTKKSLLADLGVEGPTLRNYEIGERDPDGPFVARLADLLDTSTDYLLGRTDDPRPPASETQDRKSEEIVTEPYDAFLAFLRTELGRDMKDEERETLQRVRFRTGNPTPELYGSWLLAMRQGIRPAAAEEEERRERVRSRGHVPQDGPGLLQPARKKKRGNR